MDVMGPGSLEHKLIRIEERLEVGFETVEEFYDYIECNRICLSNVFADSLDNKNNSKLFEENKMIAVQETIVDKCLEITRKNELKYQKPERVECNTEQLEALQKAAEPGKDFQLIDVSLVDNPPPGCELKAEKVEPENLWDPIAEVITKGMESKKDLHLYITQSSSSKRFVAAKDSEDLYLLCIKDMKRLHKTWTSRLGYSEKVSISTIARYISENTSLTKEFTRNVKIIYEGSSGIIVEYNRIEDKDPVDNNKDMTRKPKSTINEFITERMKSNTRGIFWKEPGQSYWKFSDKAGLTETLEDRLDIDSELCEVYSLDTLHMNFHHLYNKVLTDKILKLLDQDDFINVINHEQNRVPLLYRFKKKENEEDERNAALYAAINQSTDVIGYIMHDIRDQSFTSVALDKKSIHGFENGACEELTYDTSICRRISLNEIYRLCNYKGLNLKILIDQLIEGCGYKDLHAVKFLKEKSHIGANMTYTLTPYIINRNVVKN